MVFDKSLSKHDILDNTQLKYTHMKGCSFLLLYLIATFYVFDIRGSQILDLLIVKFIHLQDLL